MAFWADLAKGGTSGLMEGVGALVRDIGDTVRGKPTLTSAELAQLEMKCKDVEMAVMTAQTSMITAEANSSDKWTSRARPSFMYVFYFILITVGIVAPFLGVFFPQGMTTFFANIKLGFQAIPDSLYTLFGVGYTGYAASRTIDKRNKLKYGA